MGQARAFLDWNASAPLLPTARAATVAALELCANPSSVHAEGRAVRAVIEEGRRAVAALVDGQAEHVVFTSGATEAAATLLTPQWAHGREPLLFSHLYVCAADHACTVSGGRFGPEQVTRLPVHASGLLDLDVLERLLSRHDLQNGLPLVAVHAANNETGVVQPWAEIAGIVHAAGGRLVLDAVQAAGRLPLCGLLNHADHVVLSSHKIGGPKGAGAVVSRNGSVLPRPLVTGGGQERGFRAGTENVPALAGFGAAAREVSTRLQSMAGVEALRDRFETAILQLAPDAVIHGSNAPRLPNTSFFTLPGLKAETAQMAFDLGGVALSAGSACSSGKVGPSHVLQAMGVEEKEGALRVSIGPETGEADLARFTQLLEKLTRRRHGAMASAEAA